MVVQGPTNQHLRRLIVFLEKSAKKHKAPIWERAAYLLSRPTRQRPEVNLYKINSSKAAVVLVPGKVLSTGVLARKVTIGAWAFSAGARNKIEAAGGKAITLTDLVNSNASGKGIAILI